jgi:phosphatidylglycerophosphatase A
MKPNTEPAAALTSRKPRLALFFATACGLGYLPKAPGTFGSLLGIAVAILVGSPSIWLALAGVIIVNLKVFGRPFSPSILFSTIIFLVIAYLGVASASRVASHTGIEDPQYVVIDEVSGQHLTLLLGCGTLSLLNWKLLLAGLILFRVFDIWKPFPVRQAESLPGGWGIMADDWVAAVYAALGLWLLRWAGL